MVKRLNLPTAIVLIAAPAIVFAWVAILFVAQDCRELYRRAVDEDCTRACNAVMAKVGRSVSDAKQRAEVVLAGLGSDPDAETLAAAVRNEPSVRNFFRWSERGGVLFPREKGATQEESRFLARYVTLFEDGFKEKDAPQRAKTRMTKKATPAPEFTWRTWFEGERLSFLVWRRTPSGDVVGAELETMAFYSEIAEIFATEKLESGMTVALRTEAGTLLFQSGELPSSGGRTPAMTVPLPTVLPLCNLEVWRVRPIAGLGRRLAVYALLVLVAPLILALGGWLLVREVRRERTDSFNKTSFVSNVSHELKTPLTSIRLSAEMLSEGRVKDPESARRYLDVIVKECGRLTRLVNNVLDFGRLEQNRRRFELADADLAAVAAEAAESQRSRVEESGLSLAVEVPSAPVVRRIDRDAVSQVVVNLIDNAVKYAAAGKEVAVSVSAAGAVTVADRGPGIAAKHRSRIFERFYRCDDSITATSSGSGLGLSIAQGLVTQMGGTLRYAPRAGGGSEFIIDFGGRT